jgi:transposase
MTTPIQVKTAVEQVLEAQYGRPVPDLLRQLYSVDGMSQQQMADTLGVHRSTVVRWMRLWSIPTRDRRAVKETAA